MSVIVKPDVLERSRTTNMVRLFYLPDIQVNIEGSATVVCGEYNLVALGLTVEDVVRLRFLSRLPFQITPWPFDDIWARDKFADLYIKLSGDDWWG